MIMESKNKNTYDLTITDENSSTRVDISLNYTDFEDTAKYSNDTGLYSKPFFIGVRDSVDESPVGSVASINIEEAECLANGLLFMIKQLKAKQAERNGQHE
jgi:hypothetical protein